MAKFDLNDSSVVCIIGSGAGGGTLGNELAQKGIKVVCLEAGPRLKLDDICLLYTSPSPRDQRGSRMPSSA